MTDRQATAPLPLLPNPAPSTARNLSLRAQKKILGSVATKNVVKLFIDDRSAHLLDILHQLTREYTNNKRRADKLLNYTIKTAIKLAVLIRNEQLTDAQLVRCGEFRRKFHQAAVTFISFHEVDFSFDKVYLREIMKDCGELLKGVVEMHLTGKSLHRIDEVFKFYGDDVWLEWLFLDSRHRDSLHAAVMDLHQLLRDGVI
ncbi:tumor necrosis factor alpha-induced protein 8-like protein [Paramacrobiotus metropolitanus]|uniref:tumor necrosis factor alpha-induced protein 8-like protein n=1 Tax=Paramacrobiotus metropolitanus TaxID=2943436 RepID=UPI00244582D3|nr:tumor necrosis factor alpha-induced protein 8-like protein [Paramacrobiotus metropolitanus]